MLQSTPNPEQSQFFDLHNMVMVSVGWKLLSFVHLDSGHTIVLDGRVDRK